MPELDMSVAFKVHDLLAPYVPIGQDAIIVVDITAHYYVHISEHEFQFFKEGNMPTNYVVTEELT